ncbi:PREDICTED: mucin-12-like [Dipodomys ordii]|uniref:Mucin-12-like n=1 Tax=Dipodomys ordii TaxID=10020 RepID=A0A1S3FC41_DIPOR|nr:PREDICTED: mucin-12-like [Dipodomys ordii]
MDGDLFHSQFMEHAANGKKKEEIGVKKAPGYVATVLQGEKGAPQDLQLVKLLQPQAVNPQQLRPHQIQSEFDSGTNIGFGGLLSTNGVAWRDKWEESDITWSKRCCQHQRVYVRFSELTIGGTGSHVTLYFFKSARTEVPTSPTPIGKEASTLSESSPGTVTQGNSARTEVPTSPTPIGKEASTLRESSPGTVTQGNSGTTGQSVGRTSASGREITAGPPGSETTTVPRGTQSTVTPLGVETRAGTPSKEITARPAGTQSTAGPPGTTGPAAGETTRAPSSEPSTAEATSARTEVPTSPTPIGKEASTLSESSPGTVTQGNSGTTGQSVGRTSASGREITAGPPGSETTAGPPGTQSTAGPPGRETTAGPPSTETTARTPGRETTATPANTETTTGPPITETTVGPPGTKTTTGVTTSGSPGTQSTLRPPDTDTTAGTPSKETIARPAGTQSTAGPTGTSGRVGRVATTSTSESTFGNTGGEETEAEREAMADTHALVPYMQSETGSLGARCYLQPPPRQAQDPQPDQLPLLLATDQAPQDQQLVNLLEPQAVNPQQLRPHQEQQASLWDRLQHQAGRSQLDLQAQRPQLYHEAHRAQLDHQAGRPQLDQQTQRPQLDQQAHRAQLDHQEPVEEWVDLLAQPVVKAPWKHRYGEKSTEETYLRHTCTCALHAVRDRIPGTTGPAAGETTRAPSSEPSTAEATSARTEVPTSPTPIGKEASTLRESSPGTVTQGNSGTTGQSMRPTSESEREITAGPPSTETTAGSAGTQSTVGPPGMETTAGIPSKGTTARPPGAETRAGVTTAGPPGTQSTAGPPGTTGPAAGESTRAPSSEPSTAEATSARTEVPTSPTPIGKEASTLRESSPGTVTQENSGTTGKSVGPTSASGREITARPPGSETTAGSRGTQSIVRTPSKETTAGPSSTQTTAGPPGTTGPAGETTRAPSSEPSTAEATSARTEMPNSPTPIGKEASTLRESSPGTVTQGNSGTTGQSVGPTSASDREITVRPPGSETTAGPRGTQSTAGPPGRETTSGPPSTETTAGTPSRKTTARPSRTETTAGTPGRETTAGPPSTETTAGPPSTETTAGPASTETTAGPPITKTTTGVTTAGPSGTQSTAGPPGSQTTAGPPGMQTTAGSSSTETTRSPHPAETLEPSFSETTRTQSREPTPTQHKSGSTVLSAASTTAGPRSSARPDTITTGNQSAGTTKPSADETTRALSSEPTATEAKSASGELVCLVVIVSCVYQEQQTSLGEQAQDQTEEHTLTTDHKVLGMLALHTPQEPVEERIHLPPQLLVSAHLENQEPVEEQIQPPPQLLMRTQLEEQVQESQWEQAQHQKLVEEQKQLPPAESPAGAHLEGQEAQHCLLVPPLLALEPLLDQPPSLVAEAQEPLEQQLEQARELQVVAPLEKQAPEPQLLPSNMLLVLGTTTVFSGPTATSPGASAQSATSSASSRSGTTELTIGETTKSPSSEPTPSGKKSGTTGESITSTSDSGRKSTPGPSGTGATSSAYLTGKAEPPEWLWWGQYNLGQEAKLAEEQKHSPPKHLVGAHLEGQEAQQCLQVPPLRVLEPPPDQPQPQLGTDQGPQEQEWVKQLNLQAVKQQHLSQALLALLLPLLPQLERQALPLSYTLVSPLLEIEQVQPENLWDQPQDQAGRAHLDPRPLGPPALQTEQELVGEEMQPPPERFGTAHLEGQAHLKKHLEPALELQEAAPLEKQALEPQLLGPQQRLQDPLLPALEPQLDQPQLLVAADQVLLELLFPSLPWLHLQAAYLFRALVSPALGVQQWEPAVPLLPHLLLRKSAQPGQQALGPQAQDTQVQQESQWEQAQHQAGPAHLDPQPPGPPALHTPQELVAEQLQPPPEPLGTSHLEGQSQLGSLQLSPQWKTMPTPVARSSEKVRTSNASMLCSTGCHPGGPPLPLRDNLIPHGAALDTEGKIRVVCVPRKTVRNTQASMEHLELHLEPALQLQVSAPLEKQALEPQVPALLDLPLPSPPQLELQTAEQFRALASPLLGAEKEQEVLLNPHLVERKAAPPGDKTPEPQAQETQIQQESHWEQPQNQAQQAHLDPQPPGPPALHTPQGPLQLESQAVNQHSLEESQGPQACLQVLPHLVLEAQLDHIQPLLSASQVEIESPESEIKDQIHTQEKCKLKLHGDVVSRFFRLAEIHNFDNSPVDSSGKKQMVLGTTPPSSPVSGDLGQSSGVIRTAPQPSREPGTTEPSVVQSETTRTTSQSSGVTTPSPGEVGRPTGVTTTTATTSVEGPRMPEPSTKGSETMATSTRITVTSGQPPKSTETTVQSTGVKENTSPSETGSGTTGSSADKLVTTGTPGVVSETTRPLGTTELSSGIPGTTLLLTGVTGPSEPSVGVSGTSGPSAVETRTTTPLGVTTNEAGGTTREPETEVTIPKVPPKQPKVTTGATTTSTKGVHTVGFNTGERQAENRLGIGKMGFALPNSRSTRVIYSSLCVSATTRMASGTTVAPGRANTGTSTVSTGTTVSPAGVSTAATTSSGVSGTSGAGSPAGTTGVARSTTVAPGSSSTETTAFTTVNSTTAARRETGPTEVSTGTTVGPASVSTAATTSSGVSGTSGAGSPSGKH